MRKSLFCLSLFSLLLCGCNNVAANNEDFFANDKIQENENKEEPVANDKGNESEADYDYVKPVELPLKIFSLHISNEELNNVTKSFSHRESKLIKDIDSFNNFNNQFKDLLKFSDEKNNNEIKLPEIDYSKQDLAVVTYYEENTKSSFDTMITGALCDILCFKTIVYCEEGNEDEHNYASFGVAFGVLRKDIVHEIGETYYHVEELPDYWCA